MDGNVLFMEQKKCKILVFFGRGVSKWDAYVSLYVSNFGVWRA